MGQKRAAASRKFVARLVAVDSAPAREYPLRAGKTSIGYAGDNDIIVNSPTVSGHHAVIRSRPGGYEVSDLESTNGTFVNGTRITDPTPLKRGDDVRFGNARFAFLAQRSALVRQFQSIRLRPLAVIVAVTFAIGFLAVRYQVHRMNAGKSTAAKPTAAESAVAVATAAPSAVSSAVSASPSGNTSGPEWLALLNWYRKLCGLNAVTENPSLSAGDRDHVQYLLTNYSEALRSGAMPGGEMHEERDGSPGYTPDGAAAGKQSDVDFMYWHGHKPDGLVNFAILDWISGAFHRLPLLNPNLRQVGYYDFCGGGLCVAALNAIGGAVQAPGQQLFPHPVQFPPDSAEIDLRTFNSEWPDPLASCDGYAAPTGLPITLSLGNSVAAKLESFQLESIAPGGVSTKLDACGFDATSYVNSEAFAQSAGRGVLAESGTVVVIPRRPLGRGSSYGVNITVNGRSYDWKFSIAN